MSFQVVTYWEAGAGCNYWPFSFPSGAEYVRLWDRHRGLGQRPPFAPDGAYANKPDEGQRSIKNAARTVLRFRPRPTSTAQFLHSEPHCLFSCHVWSLPTGVVPGPLADRPLPPQLDVSNTIRAKRPSYARLVQSCPLLSLSQSATIFPAARLT